MDILLKQRLVGAIVLISLAVIFLPMLFTGKGEQEQKFESSIPAEPVYEIKSPRVSVPLPLPAKTLEKVPLREPVVKEELVQATPDSSAIAENTESQTPITQKPITEKPKAEKSVQQPDLQKKLPANTPPAEVVATAKPAAQASAAKETSLPPTVEIKPNNITGWVVQVGSFSQESNAEKLRDKLRKMGLASFVVTGMSNNKKVYRVRVGPEIERAEAERIQAKIKEKTKLNGLVMKYP
ncbi:SPOR domain-containing protein [Kaarinaea lacus]